MQLFYHKELKETDTSFTFSKEESKHIVKVLRKQKEDMLYITNGKGLLFHSVIEEPNDKRCKVRISKVEKKENSMHYDLHVAIAPTKNNQRLEWFLEKATEIGVTEITPIICDHSERKVIKEDRLEKVLIAAMKQSNSFHLPILNNAITFKEFVSKDRKGVVGIAHCGEGEKQEFSTIVKGEKQVTILIGPEGDFSKNEVVKALQNGYIPVSLGKTRLRTETAGIVAVHTVNLMNLN